MAAVHLLHCLCFERHPLYLILSNKPAPLHALPEDLGPSDQTSGAKSLPRHLSYGTCYYHQHDLLSLRSCMGRRMVAPGVGAVVDRRRHCKRYMPLLAFRNVSPQLHPAQVAIVTCGRIR